MKGVSSAADWLQTVMSFSSAASFKSVTAGLCLTVELIKLWLEYYNLEEDDMI